MRGLTIGMAALWSAALATTAPAQEDLFDLGADRPDLTESALTIPRGAVQLEAGFTFESGDDLETVSGPEALIRWGIADRVELRFGLPDLVDAAGDGDGVSRSDAAFGAKLRIGPAGAWDVAAIVALSLPTGEEPYTSGAYDPEVALVAGRALGSGWSVAGQVVMAWPSGDAGRRRETTTTVVAGTDLGERLGAFLEVAVIDPSHGRSGTMLHHGYTYGIGDRWQLDVHVGARISGSAPELLVGAGLTGRL